MKSIEERIENVMQHGPFWFKNSDSEKEIEAKVFRQESLHKSKVSISKYPRSNYPIKSFNVYRSNTKSSS